MPGKPSDEDVPAHVPPTGVGWMLPFYDPLSAALGITRAHDRLLTQAAIHPRHRVLDVGCGTGAMTLRMKQAHPDAVVVGLDPDQPSLDRARAKCLARGLDVRLDRAGAGSMPYADGEFDRVVSAFAIHHLPDAERPGALAEMLRVLTPSGSLHIVDFGRGDDLATELQDAGFSRGRLTRGSMLLAVPVTVVDAFR
jgi:ubiquinone/menaquinone biosynthesis C-methylase UbiE